MRFLQTDDDSRNDYIQDLQTGTKYSTSAYNFAEKMCGLLNQQDDEIAQLRSIIVKLINSHVSRDIPAFNSAMLNARQAIEGKK